MSEAGEKLKPCPFCGDKEPEILKTGPYWVRCTRCGGESCRDSSTSFYAGQKKDFEWLKSIRIINIGQYCKTKKQAIKAWNTRADIPKTKVDGLLDRGEIINILEAVAMEEASSEAMTCERMEFGIFGKFADAIIKAQKERMG